MLYNWKRFWCPRTGNINLSDGGYLFDPDSEYGRFYNSNTVSFEAIAGIPCLVLLGEPGIGKSTAMKSQQTLIEQQIVEAGGTSLWFDLRAYQTDMRLCQAIFENHVFQSWLDGEHQLHLFLDSLDECLLRIDTIAVLLLEELKKYPVKRLYLRIACRTADWPIGLEKGLMDYYGNDAVRVFELVPLRRIDVIEAVKANRLDPDTFLHEIELVQVVPFAIKPVTLQFLINIYKRDGCLPSTQKELYSQGCRILCEENSESRRDAKLIDKLSAEQRLAIAARIAAVTIFANRYAIWTGVDLGDVPEEDITFTDLQGESEFINGIKIEVSEKIIREVLSTGLFSSRGPNRMGWAHQTYAEYLAAWYLVKNQAKLIQIMNLIVHPCDPEGRIVPQLHEVSSWLASMMPELFREVMKVDPELVLLSDVTTVDDSDKEALAENLLKLYDEEKLLDFNFDIRRQYRKLSCPRLAEQLKPYIQDSSKGFVVRRVAIDIAEDCGLKELQGVLADIALDPSQQSTVRVNAAYAVCKIGDEETKAMLKPLAIGEAGDDSDDDLKGCGLKAVWPGHMTAKELFSVLTPPRRSNLYGAYKGFISNDIFKHIKPDDLKHALKWAEKQQPGYGFTSTFNDLEDEIMAISWEYLELPDVLEGFAKTVISRLENYDQVIEEKSKIEKFRKELYENDQKRRQILKAIILLLENPKEESFWLINTETPFVFSKDIPWMIKCLQTAASEKEQWVWAYLIYGVFDIEDSKQSEAIYITSKSNLILNELFKPLLRPIMLNSLEAKKAKENYLIRKKWQERHQNRPLLKPSPAERIEILLDKFETGDLDAWWQLNRVMTLKIDSTHFGDELESNLNKLHGWEAADVKTRRRIVQAAKKYVLEQDPQTSEWLGKNNLYFPAFAGYRALILLLQEEPGYLNSLSSDIWKKWAPMIIAYPVSSGFEDEGTHQKIISMAYQQAPEEIIKILLVMIEEENRKQDHIYITRKILGCWDDQIASALLVKAKKSELKPKCMGCLLGDLLEHGNLEAEFYARSLVTFPAPKSQNERQRAIIAYVSYDGCRMVLGMASYAA